MALAVIWRRARWHVAGAAVVLFWLTSSGWLAAVLIDWAQPGNCRTPYDPAAARPPEFGGDATIVLLGGGTDKTEGGSLVPKRDVYARIAAVAALYAQCRLAGANCRVIVSGGNPQHHAQAEADVYAPYLLRAGVPAASVVLENRSLNTWQNARNVAQIVDPLPVHGGTLLLVTSAYHMRRALLDFTRFGLAPQPVVANVRYAQTGLLPRRRNLETAETALHELIGTAQFYVYRRIGWF